LKEYFNAGVILFNDISALDNKFVDMQKLIYKKFKYHDQDILNLVLSETFSALPSKYNHMSLAKSDDAILVHFAHNKPWDYPCLYQNAREYMAELELRLGPIECTKLSVLRVFRLLVARYFG
jgi:lipopolysaccharide biosynthesis glycosyltransferase